MKATALSLLAAMCLTMVASALPSHQHAALHAARKATEGAYCGREHQDKNACAGHGEQVVSSSLQAQHFMFLY